MSNHSTPPFKRIDRIGYSDIINTGKNERGARSALQDLVIFYDALENEMKRVHQAERKGAPVDKKLLQHMERVKDAYWFAMRGFKDFELNRERHALIVFADAVQDMITYIHKNRPH